MKKKTSFLLFCFAKIVSVETLKGDIVLPFTLLGGKEEHKNTEIDKLVG